MSDHLRTVVHNAPITDPDSMVARGGTESSSLLQSDASRTNILGLQVRAFLDAAQDIEIDAETVEDLVPLISDSSEYKVHGLGGNDSEDDDDEESIVIDMEELDISALYSIEDEASVQETWSKEDRRRMMHYLKEHGISSFINKYVVVRDIPIPKLLRAFGIDLCPELHHKRPVTMLYFLRVAMSRELRLREKLPDYNTITDAVNLIRASKRILILTGAGISVSCGIPDFRSRDGLYASLGQYELDDPQQMFDINYFKENPSVFYSFASQIYPSNFVPSPCHRFIKLIEDKDKLLRNYTQNIDTLETQAGVHRVLQCHGSFATASCLLCRRRVPGSDIEADIQRRKVPLCTVCNSTERSPPKTTAKSKKKSRKKAKGQWDSEEEDESDGPVYPPCIMKPDITFFGEQLTDEFDRSLAHDRDKVDLLLVIGTSLKVSPVADILSHLPHSVPQILINKTPVRHINPDIILLGNSDDIVLHLCDQLGWDLPSPTVSPTSASITPTRLHPNRVNIKKRSSSELDEYEQPSQVGDTHIWLFDGADGGKWLKDIQREIANLEHPRAPDLKPVDGGSGDVEHREAKKPKF